MNAERLLEHFEKIADAPDAIARLRRFTLDLAVRGKLVPQDPRDEPASELLKRIEREKARLVKAGEIRKPKALPNVEEPPFDLPPTWRWTPVREVTSDHGHEIPKSPFTYIDVTAIDKEAGVVADPKVLVAADAPSRARKITRKGDVIYSCVRPYLLNVAVIEVDFDPPPIASTAFAILNGHDLLLPRYIWIVLRSPFMVACVEENQRGQAYPAINDADFAVLPFPLPPLAEQHRIVAKVDELMGLCDRLEAARAGREAVRDRLAAASLSRLTTPDTEAFQADARFALDALPALTTRPDQIKQLRQTILNLAVRGKLVPQDTKDEPASELLKRIENEKARLISAGNCRDKPSYPNVAKDEMPFDVPAAWRWVRFANIADFSAGRTPSRNDTSFWNNGDHAWVSIADMLDGQVLTVTKETVTDKARERVFGSEPEAPGTIIMSFKLTIGKIARLGIPAFHNEAIISIRPHLSDLDAYMFMVLPQFARQGNTKGAIKGATLNRDSIANILFPLPPLAEQHRIVAKVNALMALCDRLEASLTATAATRPRLLDALLAEALEPAEVQEVEAVV